MGESHFKRKKRSTTLSQGVQNLNFPQKSIPKEALSQLVKPTILQSTINQKSNKQLSSNHPTD